MTTFAEVLARIEELVKGGHSEYDELGDLLIQYADSIVKLAKVAQVLRIEAGRLADKVCWDGDEDLWRHLSDLDVLMKKGKG